MANLAGAGDLACRTAEKEALRLRLSAWEGPLALNLRLYVVLFFLIWTYIRSGHLEVCGCFPLNMSLHDRIDFSDDAKHAVSNSM